MRTLLLCARTCADKLIEMLDESVDGAASTSTSYTGTMSTCTHVISCEGYSSRDKQTLSKTCLTQRQDGCEVPAWSARPTRRDGGCASCCCNQRHRQTRMLRRCRRRAVGKLCLAWQRDNVFLDFCPTCGFGTSELSVRQDPPLVSPSAKKELTACFVKGFPNCIQKCGVQRGFSVLVVSTPFCLILRCGGAALQPGAASPRVSCRRPSLLSRARAKSFEVDEVATSSQDGGSRKKKKSRNRRCGGQWLSVQHASLFESPALA